MIFGKIGAFMDVTTIIIDVALGLVGGLSLLMIKWLREDIKETKLESKEDFKDLKIYLEVKFSKIDGQFSKVHDHFEHQAEKISAIQIALGKLETRVEERTLKVIHVERNGTEHQDKSG